VPDSPPPFPPPPVNSTPLFSFSYAPFERLRNLFYLNTYILMDKYINICYMCREVANSTAAK